MRSHPPRPPRTDADTRRRTGIVGLVAMTLVLAVLSGSLATLDRDAGWAGAEPSSTQDEDPPAMADEAEGPPLPEGYVGTAECASCHGSQATLLRRSAHEVIVTHPDSIGCEICHGAGEEHVLEFDDPALIRHPRKLSRNDSETLCMTCHGEESWVPDWYRSDWYRDGLSCVDCHTVHQTAVAAASASDPSSDGAGPAAPGTTPIAEPGTTPIAVPGTTPIAEPGPTSIAVPEDFPPLVAVGSAECRTCHTSACATFESSAHIGLEARELERPACESCHGPGSRHVATGGYRSLILNPLTAPVERAEAACLACHQSTGSLSGWARSSHHRAEVSCMTCHEDVAHRGARERAVHQMESCGQCHRDVVSEFRFPNHHRVPEGALACTDCHNPHETVSPIHDRELRTDSCVGCHREKEGPFVYAHNADRVDGCVVCHEPHGSINRRLLTHRESRQLCLQCHSNLPPLHDQSPGSVYRNCLTCHTEIHGSNLSPMYFR